MENFKDKMHNINHPNILTLVSLKMEKNKDMEL